MKRKVLIIGGVTLGVMLLLPLTAAAVTKPELITILQAGLADLLKVAQEMAKLTQAAWRDAMCADGVTAFCP